MRYGVQMHRDARGQGYRPTALPPYRPPRLGHNVAVGGAVRAGGAGGGGLGGGPGNAGAGMRYRAQVHRCTRTQGQGYRPTALPPDRLP